MIITCEACNTSFSLDEKMLKPTGSKVRCSICAKVFTAYPQGAPSPEPAAPGSAPAPTADSAPEAITHRPSADAAGGADSAAAETVAIEETDLDFPFDTLPDESPATKAAVDDDLTDFDFDTEPIQGDGKAADTDEDIDATMIDKLEDDGFDLDLDLGGEGADETATIVADMDADDFDLDLDLSGTSDVTDETATVIADLDADDFDLSLDDQPALGVATITDLDADELALDIPEAPESVAEDSATIIANLDDQTFALEEDLALDAEAEARPASEPDTLAAGDLELDLNLEPEIDAADGSLAADGGDIDDLDLTLSLDEADAAETKPADKTPQLEDDLDLSSLEGLLGDDEEEDSTTMVVDDIEDSELSLAMDDDTSVAGPPAAEAAESPLEALELDLDGGEDADLADGDQDIDLSEIEKMLEEPISDDAKFAAVPEQDLDLDVEASLETEKWMSDSAGDGDQLVMDEELDLSELEQVLEDVDTAATDDTVEDQELELDLEESEKSGTSSDTIAIDNELDFDLSAFEEDTPASAIKADGDRESADMELDFEVEENKRAEQTLDDDGLEETVAIAETKADVTKPRKAPMVSKPARPAARPVKKGSSKSMIVLLIILLLGGGGYAAYYFLNQQGIEIPFLSQYLKPKVQDPGNLKLTTYDINSKFIDNAGAGKLFVISGMIKNGYNENRGMVTLIGKLFSTGKVVINQEKVYAGNVMSDLELTNLEWDKIQARLANRLGDNRSNVKIEPGKSIPFMVVFSGLPDDLEEFTIEVTGSTSLK